MTFSVHKFGRLFLFPFNREQDALDFLASDKHNIKEIRNISSYLKKLSCKYLLRIADDLSVECSKPALRRLISAFENKKAGIVYSDFFLREKNKLIKHPLIDYQPGSIRDDFNFGHLLIYSCDAVQNAFKRYGSVSSDADVALYDLRLKISVDHEIVHVPEFLYTVSSVKQERVKASGRKTQTHFAYVAKENFIRQKKLEKIATNHLKRIGAHLPSRTKFLNKDRNVFQWKASVIIPVLNRKKTIADALNSALEQKTDFPFNVIVVDNHSTDRTTDILKKFAAKYPHIHHLMPSRRDLGIGGCWNEAIYSPYCGRYVIQLDSDDLYSSPQSLQKIVNTLRRGRYAMVVGSYTIVNEHLKKIPPGLIDHREWTQTNGHNNLLRVNGMGAPRAFELSVIRKIGFPNVSYGEDYAAALRITREYKVGRIFENLYWCRRWKDNTDSGLSTEKKNRNDYYKDKLRTAEIEARKTGNTEKTFQDNKRLFAEFNGGKDLSLPLVCQSLYDTQKQTWLEFAFACGSLAAARTRKLSGAYKVYLQYNPARAVSSGAAVDARSISTRPCFLCENNLPPQQMGILYRNEYWILCNPAPIFQNHFTIVSLKHEPQEIASSIDRLLQLSAEMPGYAVFYNGPGCGASAPDHLHLQAVPRKSLPFLQELKKFSLIKATSSILHSRLSVFDRSVIIFEGDNAESLMEQFQIFLRTAQNVMKTDNESMVNVICDYNRRGWRLIVFLRGKHRPDVYFAKGKNRVFVSPGAVDMAGVIITPLLDNYNNLDYNDIREIYHEVSLPENIMDSIIQQL